MDLVNTLGAKIAISFSRGELAFLCSAINETLETIEDWEFETRTGETRAHAAIMRDDLRAILDASP